MNNSLVAAVRAAATPSESSSLGVTQNAAQAVAMVTQSNHDAAVAAARSEGRADGERAGASAERARVAAILDHDSAKGRETLARHFAFKTEMKAEDAQAALAAAPKETKETETGLLAEMSKINQPALGAGGGKGGSDLSDVEKGAMEAKRVLGIA